MQDQLSALLAKAAAELPAIATRPDFEAAKARFVGPNGELTALMKQMGSVPKEQKPVVGKLVNEAKTALQSHLDAALARIEAAALAAQLGPTCCPTRLSRTTTVPASRSCHVRRCGSSSIQRKPSPSDGTERLQRTMRRPRACFTDGRPPSTRVTRSPAKR